VGGTEIAHSATIVGSPTAAGNEGPAGLAGGFSLTGETAGPSKGGTATLQCSHDDTNGSTPYVDSGVTLSATWTASAPVLTSNTSNISLPTTGALAGHDLTTTVLSTSLAPGSYNVAASGDLVNFGPSDFGRCYLDVDATQVAQTATIVGSPTAAGDNGPAGIIGGVALLAGVTIGTGGATVTLKCGHDHTSSTPPYFDAGGSLLATPTSTTDSNSTSSNIALSKTPSTNTTVLTLPLLTGSYVLSASGDLVNFGPSDFGRCSLYLGTTEIAHTATTVGTPIADGDDYAAGLVAGVSLSGGVTVPAGGATATLQCSHDTVGSTPYFDTGGTLLAASVPSEAEAAPGRFAGHR
jgi:hypothetical protein